MLTVAGVSKSFTGNPVLKNIDLLLEPGKAHALVGENGAGKSTLVKIISGGLTSYQGSLELDGRPYRPSSPSDAQARGVVAVQQELSLSPYLPVYQNLWLGKSGGRGLLSGKAELRRKSRELIDRYGISMELGRWVGDLSLEEQQLVEILKALAFDPKVVIFDEPTSALGAANTRWLLDLIADLKRRGRAVMLISHRLPEIMELADTFTVLKDGAKVATVERGDVEEQDIVRLMVGRDLSEIFPRKPKREELAQHPTLLEVRRLAAKGVDGVSFSIRAGEVVGLAGLEGQGQHDVLLALFGVNAAVSGEITIAGADAAAASPSEAIRLGVGLVPIDRRTEGVVLPLSISENVALASLGKRQRWGWVDRRKERQVVQRAIADLGIHATGPGAAVLTLSGGNQQKVVLGKWLATAPRVLLMDDPTRGVDIEARSDIYHQIREVAAQGVAVLLNSTDTLELVGLCDRVLVMFEGRLAKELVGEAITEEAIVGAAVGVVGDSHVAA
jgi:ribose transport system ATP-binding protein